MTWVSRIGLVRGVVGAAALTVPHAAGRIFGLGLDGDAIVVARLFGARNLLVGYACFDVAALPARRMAGASLALDIVDAAAIAHGHRRGAISARARSRLLAALAATAACSIAALSGHPGDRSR